ncbi:carboxypeptidase regulatory-like domain-containing protein [Thiolapillus sp.]
MAKTRPLRELAAQSQAVANQVMEAYPALPVPRQLPEQKGEVPVITDPVVQTSIPQDAKMPATVANFEGINNVNGVLPPDTVGDVGPNHYVQMVNLSYQVWDKSGNSLLGPLASNTIWSALPDGNICKTNNDGDPIVLYDQAADRWLLSQFALDFGGSNGFHECIAISQTGDPTGAFYVYDFKISDTKMNDYPHLGVWPDGYYMSINQFDASTSAWAGAGAVAFERDKMLQGLPAQLIYFDDPDPALGGMLPADWDGTTPPPAGAPNLFMQLGGDNASLDIWAFHADWTTPTNSTFTSLSSPAVAAFDPNMCGGSRTCIAQPGGTALDPLADRLMFRVQYRNFGTYEAMVANHTVDADGNDKAGVRWYELRNSGAGWAVANQGTYAPDGDNRWMASAAMDSQGNIAIGYSVSSTSTFPSIRYTGRLVGDPANTLPQGEATLIAGGGSQSHSASRWGDYSSMNVDPVDDCTFWYTQEYYSADSSANWQTRIGSFKFPGCTAGASGALNGTVTTNTPAPGTPVEGALVDLGGISTTTDATGAYNFNSVPVGTYTLTVSKWGYVTKSVSNVSVTDGGTTTEDVVIDPAPMATVSGVVTDGSGHGWPLYAAINISGAPIPTLHTDPVTGAYSVTLPEGSNVTINVSVDGYLTQARGITVPAGSSTEDFSMLIDQLSCSAPGYVVSVLSENFDGGTFPPAGWSVVDDAGNGVVWSNVAGSGEGGNFTGGAGDAASVSSDVAGSKEFDTSLVSPALVAAGGDSLSYLANYQNYGNDFLDVDISINGAGWTTLLSWNDDHGGFRAPPGELVQLDLSSVLSAGDTYQLRWHYYNPSTGDWDWYAQIDNVAVGDCIPDASVGGLVVGNVYDANTGVALNDATISLASGSSAASSAPTPDDPALDDGFYMMAVPAGSNAMSATTAGYGIDSRTVDVPAGGVVRQDFDLPAGLLSATPSSMTMTLWEGMTWSKSLDLVNAGGSAADYTLMEFNLPWTAPQPAGPWAEKVRHASPKHLHDKDASLLRYVQPSLNVGTAALINPNVAGDLLSQFTTGLDFPWGISFNKDADDLWVSNIGSAVGGTDDSSHRFLRNGSTTTDTIAAPWMNTFIGDGAYDALNGTIWQVNVGGDNCIYESDLATMAPSGRSICPAFGTSMRGLAYDPVSDTFYAGSWNDSTIHHFDRNGVILDSKNVGLAISGLAFNPDTRHLFVLSNVDNATSADDIAVLDVTNDYAVVASFDTGMPDNKQGGLGISCDGHLWAVQQPGSNGAGDDLVLEIDSGEPTACAWNNIDWLSETPVSGIVAANASESIEFVFDSTALAPGNYVAHVKVTNDTPYGSLPIPVVFNVIPYEQMFADVPPSHQFYNWIQSIGFAGITSGCDNQTPLPNYCDTDNVTRAQMAIFLERGIHGSDFTPPPATGTVFGDVSDGYWAAAWIEQFVADGITAGCGGGNYCPDANVTRAEMAIFLLRAEHGASYTPPPATGTVFGDVAQGDFGAAWIEQLVSEGITSGCGGGNYCPNDPVTRGQMAVFIQRGFNLPIHP